MSLLHFRKTEKHIDDSVATRRVNSHTIFQTCLRFRVLSKVSAVRDGVDEGAEAVHHTAADLYISYKLRERLKPHAFGVKRLYIQFHFAAKSLANNMDNLE